MYFKIQSDCSKDMHLIEGFNLIRGNGQGMFQRRYFELEDIAPDGQAVWEEHRGGGGEGGGAGDGGGDGGGGEGGGGLGGGGLGGGGATPHTSQSRRPGTKRDSAMGATRPAAKSDRGGRARGPAGRGAVSPMAAGTPGSSSAGVSLPSVLPR